MELANRVGAGVLKLLGVDPDGSRAIRALTAQQLLDVEARLSTPESPWPQLGMTPIQPCVDSTTLPRIPLEAVRDGAVAGIDMLIGLTLEEYKPFGKVSPGLSEMDIAGLVEGMSMKATRLLEGDRRGDLETLVQGYRYACAERGLEAAPPDLMLTLEGDRVFRMPAVLVAETQTPHPGRARNYVFTWKAPWKGGSLGACHGVYMGFVYGTVDANRSREFHGDGPEAEALESICQAGWLNFARTGNPSGPIVGDWPEYSVEWATMLLGVEQSVARDFTGEEQRA